MGFFKGLSETMLVKDYYSPDIYIYRMIATNIDVILNIIL